MKTNKLLTIPGVLVTTTLLTGLVLASNITKADDNTNSSDAVSITVDSACTMTGGPTGESTTDNTYSANVNPGSSTEITGSKLVTICNDNNGYSIYATGFSGDSYDTNNTKLLSTKDHTYDIDTAVVPASPIPSTPSSWAMKLQAVEGLTPPTIELGWDSYHVIPSSYTQIAEFLASTASPSSAGATVQTKYQVYINSTQVADTYTGKVKYTMVHPSIAPAPTPPVSETCDTPVPNLTYMQDLNSSNKSATLASMTEDKQYFLKDKRDEKSYCVAKLKDGNIWMTQNLDHNIDANKTYTSTDTDITADWRPLRSTYTTGTTTWDDEGTYGLTTPESYDPGELYVEPNYNDYNELAWEYIYSCWDDACDPSLFNQLPRDWQLYLETCDDSMECDESIRPEIISSTGAPYKHLGNYYNWTAAIAMNDSSSYTSEGQDANQSICPANWTLPKGGENVTKGSSQYLVTQYGWDGEEQFMMEPPIWEYPIRMVISGVWTGTYSDDYDEGLIASSTSFDSESSYIMNVSVEGVSPNEAINRSTGISIRCVSR